MLSQTKLTDEIKRNILEDYNGRALTMREMEQKYHRARAELARIAVEMGAEPRSKVKYGRPNAHRKSNNVICAKCKKAIPITGAKFCCFCGADIRSEKDKLIERLEKQLEYTRYLPNGLSEEMRDTILAAIKELKG